MRRRRSTAGTFRSDVLDRLLEADATPAVSLDPFKHLIQAWPLSQAPQLGGKVLLQGLPTLLGPALEACVDIVGDISNEHIRHAYIMLSAEDGSQVGSGPR